MLGDCKLFCFVASLVLIIQMCKMLDLIRTFFNEFLFLNEYIQRIWLFGLWVIFNTKASVLTCLGNYKRKKIVREF